MSDQAVVAGPHAHSMSSVTRTMVLVMLALAPATIFGLYRFGWPAIFLFATTIVSAVAFEAICLRIANKPLMRFLTDGSAILSGWLVAMTLPPWAPWWIGVLGAAIAIVIAKHVYGGLGQNVFNPAILAILITGLIGWIDEGIQAFIPNRVYDIRDAFTNLVAAILAISGKSILLFLRKQFNNSKESTKP